MSADKCPHCGARVIGRHPALNRFVCFSELRGSELIISSLCNDRKEAKDEERAAHAETKRELNAMRSQYESLACQLAESRTTLCRLRVARDAAEARVAELEECRTENKRWQSLAFGKIQSTSDELKRLAIAEARVAELEAAIELARVGH